MIYSTFAKRLLITHLSAQVGVLLLIAPNHFDGADENRHLLRLVLQPCKYGTRQGQYVQLVWIAQTVMLYCCLDDHDVKNRKELSKYDPSSFCEIVGI